MHHHGIKQGGNNAAYALRHGTCHRVLHAPRKAEPCGHGRACSLSLVRRSAACTCISTMHILLAYALGARDHGAGLLLLRRAKAGRGDVFIIACVGPIVFFLLTCNASRTVDVISPLTTASKALLMMACLGASLRVMVAYLALLPRSWLYGKQWVPAIMPLPKNIPGNVLFSGLLRDIVQPCTSSWRSSDIASDGRSDM